MFNRLTWTLPENYERNHSSELNLDFRFPSIRIFFRLELCVFMREHMLTEQIIPKHTSGFYHILRNSSLILGFINLALNFHLKNVFLMNSPSFLWKCIILHEKSPVNSGASGRLKNDPMLWLFLIVIEFSLKLSHFTPQTSLNQLKIHISIHLQLIKWKLWFSLPFV
jgi:hypothetical protein